MTRRNRLWIGMMIFVAALVLIFWSFSLPCLRKHQADILRAVLSLAAGFIAWSFHGALDLKITDARWEGVAIGAVGGFGVFVLMLYVFQPSSSNCDPVVLPGAASREKLADLRMEVIGLVAEYNNRRPNANLLNDIRKKGEQRANDLLQLPKDSFVPAEHIAVHLNAAYGFLVSCLSEDLMPDASKEFVASCAHSLVREATTALRIVENSDIVPQNGVKDQVALAAYRAWLQNDSVADRTQYALAIGHALLEKYKSKGADLSLTALQKMDRSFRQQANILDEPILRSMCKKFKGEEWVKVCA